MVVSAGIDAGTSTFCAFVMEDGKPIESLTVKTDEVKRDPSELLSFLRDHSPDAVAGPSGLGMPVKRFSELSDLDVFLMTLNLGKRVLGLRRVIEEIRRSEISDRVYTVPGVIHLGTVPRYRKVNRIDMGTSDKVCSTVLAVYELKTLGVDYENQNFVLVEAGSGFNAFIAVKGGRIVDGIGGTSGFPSFSSIGSIDGELAYILGDWEKDLLSRGGLRSLLLDMGMNPNIEDLPEFVVEWISEFIAKGIAAVGLSVGRDYDVLASGKFFELYSKEFEEFTGIRVRVLKGFGIGKRAAEGGAVIADGIAGGRFRDIVEWMRITHARGSVLDYLTSDVRSCLREEVRRFYEVIQS